MYYHAGIPRAWVPGGERTLAQVKWLLNMMPGVEVTRVGLVADHTCLGLAVTSLPSLARLAYAACAANVRFQVGVDSYRQANGGLRRDDPAGILYRIEVFGPREPNVGGSPTTLQVLGIYLADDLREQGLWGRTRRAGLSRRSTTTTATPEQGDCSCRTTWSTAAAPSSGP